MLNKNGYTTQKQSFYECEHTLDDSEVMLLKHYNINCYVSKYHHCSTSLNDRYMFILYLPHLPFFMLDAFFKINWQKIDCLSNNLILLTAPSIYQYSMHATTSMINWIEEHKLLYEIPIMRNVKHHPGLNEFYVHSFNSYRLRKINRSSEKSDMEKRFEMKEKKEIERNSKREGNRIARHYERERWSEKKVEDEKEVEDETDQQSEERWWSLNRTSIRMWSYLIAFIAIFIAMIMIMTYRS